MSYTLCGLAEGVWWVLSLISLSLWGVRPYRNVEDITIEAPMTNCIVGAASPSASHDTRLDIKMDKEVAKPFKMLSAYFIVTDTISPPKAWNVWDFLVQLPHHLQKTICYKLTN